MEIGKELATELLKIVKNTKDFVVEQAPDVVRQLVQWKIYENTLCILFAGGFIAMCVWALLKLKAKVEAKDSRYDWNDPECGMPAIMLIIGGLTLTVWLCDSAFELVKVGFAPKIFLLEYLAKLVK